MNAKFVSSRIDMEKGYGIDLAMKYRIQAFPTALIFNPEGQLVYRIMGYSEPQKYILDIQKALDPKTQEKYKGISTKVEQDFPQFYKDVFAGNGKRKFADEATVTAFLDQQKDLFSEVSWSVLVTCRMSEKYKQHFLDNIKKYSELYGSEVDNKTTYLMYDLLSAAIKEKSDSKLKACLEGVDKYVQLDKEQISESFKLSYYSETGNWKPFAAEFEKYITRNGYSNPGSINNYCWNIYEKCEDPDVTTKACKWMEEAVKKEPSYMYVDTYAALLFKTGKYREAEQAANQAIKTGKETGENVKSTEELLGKIKAALPR
jgi:thioredoxin-related protein